MAPPKASRKGKKAWRKNIDSAEVEAHIAKESHEERHGPAAKALPDQALFFVDKDAAHGEAEAAALGLRSGKRRGRVEAKPLRSHLIIQAAHLAKPVPLPKRKVRKLGESRTAPAPVAAGDKALVERPPAPLEFKVVTSKKQAAVQGPLLDVWGAGGDLIHQALTTGPRGGRPRILKKPKQPRPAPIPAVEVDKAGCSFNPEFNQHQDALAELVAQEMKKVIRKQLEPQAPLRMIGGDVEEPVAEDMEDEEVDRQQLVDGGGEAGGTQSGGTGGTKRGHEKKTVQDRSRQKRRLEEERALEVRRALKRQRRELDALPRVKADLEEERTGQEARRLRRQVVKAEKATCQPPRLGKGRYQEAATQVLTTDEVTGSLRELKPCSMVAAQRFNSLQKRGLIEPRKPQGDRTPRSKVEYEQGGRTEKAVAMQQEVEAMQKSRRMSARKKDRQGAPGS